MRHLLLTALLAAAPFAVQAADEGGGAFGDLVRKPANTVCPFDGNPVDPSMPPVPMVGADGQEVMVGACSQVCVNRLHGTFGEDMRKLAAAAKSNTTLAKLPASGPSTAATAPGATPGAFGPPPAPSATAPGAFAPQTPATSASATAAANAATVKNPGPSVVTTAPVASGAKSEKAEKPKTEKAAKKHEEPISDLRGDQSDERQRQKKAAQRRDRGVSEDGEAPRKSSSKKKSSKTDAIPAADAPLDNGTAPIGQ